MEYVWMMVRVSRIGCGAARGRKKYPPLYKTREDWISAVQAMKLLPIEEDYHER